MSRLLPLTLICVCLGFSVNPLAAAGADDRFIIVYQLIQRADSQRDAGQLKDAYTIYARAQEDLRRLQKTHPAWNEKVINYRLRYVAEKLEELKAFVPASLEVKEQPAATPITNAVPANAIPAESLAPAGEVLTQFNALNEQIQRLSGEKQLLEAKLREALSAQPAPVDPRELQTAVERIAALQETNKVLVATLEAQQAERKNLIEKVVAEEAQQALNEANRQLLAQKIAAAKLQKEKQETDAQLKQLEDGTVRKLEGENSALKQQVTELKADTEKGRQIAELAGKLSKLQSQLDEVQHRNETLLVEKSALEKQLNDAQIRRSEESVAKIAKLETDLAVARLDASRSTSRAEELLMALSKEKQTRGKLELENKSLTERIAALTQSDTTGNESVKTLQAALDAEKNERTRLENELRAAEQQLADLAKRPTAPPEVSLSVPSSPAPAPAANALVAQNQTVVATSPAPVQVVTPGPVETERVDSGPSVVLVPDPAAMARVRDLEGDVRQMRTALTESKDRESELRAALAEEETMRLKLQREKGELERRVVALARVQTKTETKSVATLEKRVHELERERDSLQKRLALLSSKVVMRLASIKRPMATPRESAAAFRSER